MKTEVFTAFIFVIALMFLLTLAAVAQGPRPTTPPVPQGTPTPITPIVPSHVPYDPFKRLATLLEYPYNNLHSLRFRPQPRLTKPAGIDLDVTYIGRTPLYNRYEVWYTSEGKPYLRPDTENDKRWPAAGEVVTFTAHIMNKGTVPSGSFAFKWFIDGSQVRSGTHGSLAPGAEGTQNYQWVWAHTLSGERLQGSHTVRFTVDPANAIAETYESNNSLTDRTDAISLILAVTPELYAALETPVDSQWPYSAEDWLQKQIAAMNAAFVRSVYTSTPSGITERVRLDKILVASTEPPADWNEDGGFWMSADDRFGNAYYDPTTDVSGGLLHELSHQLGVIDLYNLNFGLEVPQVIDQNGWPLQMETFLPAEGLMQNPGILPPIYEEHTAIGLNSNKGYRRGYYGEYLYDVPGQSYLRIRDNRGFPAAGVTVKVYQLAQALTVEGRAIDNVPEISGVTGTDGVILLPNRPVGAPVSTRTGHTLHDNPFGIINVAGIFNDEFILELTKGTHQEFGWLEITRFNIAAAQSGGGGAILEIASHVPSDNAPLPPLGLTGIQEFGLVKLQWSPSPSPNIVGYNLYRTISYPTFAYVQIVTGTTGLNYTVSFDYDWMNRAIAYAVTAVDTQGRESGFSNLFNAFRLMNPASLAIDDQNRRIVLDPQNAYAVLIQLPNGRFFDTLSSTFVEFEHSQFLARDSQGRLIISYPGDWYSARHSIQVIDQESNILLEFGAQGSGPGQFETPAGVAVRGQPCTIEGPYPVDAHTLLLLHFDGSYSGAQGESGTASGTNFVPGKYGQGVLITDTASLSYMTTGNFNPEQGAVEFWFQPWWSADAGVFRIYLEINADPTGNAQGSTNQFLLWNDYYWNGNIPVFYMVNSSRSARADLWTPPWTAGNWYHLTATWRRDEKMRLYLNNTQIGESQDTTPVLDVLADMISIGFAPGFGNPIGGVIDELRISDIPRVGNSDTCTYRILVADSGNHRIQAFDALGNFVSAYGSFGSGPGQFNSPQGLAVDSSGRVIVADQNNNRLQVLSFDGSNFGFTRSITAGFNGPIGVAAYGVNRIIVADTGNNKVKVLDANGNLLTEYNAPNDGHLGTFNQPRGVAADRYGNIVVADTGNQRVVTLVKVLPSWTIHLPLIMRSP